MSYIDGVVAAVPDANREAYRAHAEQTAVVFRRHGATKIVECWGDDVPEGKLTSFPMAVQRAEGETVVFSWIMWPSRAVRDAAWQAIMANNEISSADMPFDGKRMIFGGFQVMLEA
jgi:uncharacterized protein YbaA (DUF1428 family)